MDFAIIRYGLNVFFSLLKRGVNGTFHHISREHLLFYLNEIDFWYNLRDVKK